MSDLWDQLNDLYKLHLAAVKLEHGVKTQRWELFEPSKFIYSYFAFNSFYSINWEESFREESLVTWEYNKVENTETVKESNKIHRMIKFIYDAFVNDRENNNEFKTQKDEFVLTLSSKIETYLPSNITVEVAIDALNYIIPDVNISRQIKDSFINNFDMVIHHMCTGKKIKDAWNNILYFVYSVRNNIFHGSKTIIDMMEPGQKKRLDIYSAILLATNEMLFEAIEKKFEWSRIEMDKVFQWQQLHRKTQLVNNFYRTTLKSKFNINVPEGPLFYPCSGYDTYHPIRLFVDSISEFHFIDNRMPTLECTIDGYQESDTRPNHSINRAPKNIFSKEIVKGVFAFEPYEDNVDIELLKHWERRGIKSTGFEGNNGELYKQEWELVKDNRKITIYRHMQDGLAALTKIEQMAVFFLRRDSHGEGGSGQSWFQESIFKLILDKLLDGGLIVTDGSSWDPQSYETAEWKSLWAHRDKNIKDIKNKPNDFEYYNREFRCIGVLGLMYGPGYGPVYVWQVKKI